MNFADRLDASGRNNGSFIVAGFDPVIETLPAFIIKEAGSREDPVYRALTGFHEIALEALSTSIAAVKPNFGFFIQYGLSGVKAFQSICAMAQGHGLPVIADAKVGDIGNTAKAYSSAFLGARGFNVDALTVNPYLGFDTLEPFLEECAGRDKGIFVLVKTSNPGSADLQNSRLDEGASLCEKIAEWASKRGALLRGDCGYSSLGAVVGATYPHEAKLLRSLMPDNLFLIPGMGAQGGSAQDAVQGFSARGAGAVINLSRVLLGAFSPATDSPQALAQEISERAGRYNAQIANALAQV